MISINRRCRRQQQWPHRLIFFYWKFCPELSSNAAESTAHWARTRETRELCPMQMRPGCQRPFNIDHMISSESTKERFWLDLSIKPRKIPAISPPQSLVDVAGPAVTRNNIVNKCYHANVSIARRQPNQHIRSSVSVSSLIWCCCPSISTFRSTWRHCFMNMKQWVQA